MKSIPEVAALMADGVLTAFTTLFDRPVNQHLHTTGLSWAQMMLLAYLSEEGYMTMTDISRKTGNSTAAATGMIDRMEKLGYVERMHASDDRRKVFVQMAPRGLQTLHLFRGFLSKHLQDVLSAASNSGHKMLSSAKAVADAAQPQLKPVSAA